MRSCIDEGLLILFRLLQYTKCQSSCTRGFLLDSKDCHFVGKLAGKPLEEVAVKVVRSQSLNTSQLEAILVMNNRFLWGYT